MKEITPEVRERIFALYWGQRIAMYKTDQSIKFRIGASNFDLKNAASIELRSLADITDEEAKEVARILDVSYSNHSYSSAFFDLVGLADWLAEMISNNEMVCHSLELLIQLIDYLRSIGIALPAFGFTVDELVEAGVFKIKTNKNDTTTYPTA